MVICPLINFNPLSAKEESLSTHSAEPRARGKLKIAIAVLSCSHCKDQYKYNFWLIQIVITD